jgi:hypothetical protein
MMFEVVAIIVKFVENNEKGVQSLNIANMADNGQISSSF